MHCERVFPDLHSQNRGDAYQESSNQGAIQIRMIGVHIGEVVNKLGEVKNKSGSIRLQRGTRDSKITYWDQFARQNGRLSQFVHALQHIRMTPDLHRTCSMWTPDLHPTWGRSIVRFDPYIFSHQSQFIPICTFPDLNLMHGSQFAYILICFPSCWPPRVRKLFLFCR